MTLWKTCEVDLETRGSAGFENPRSGLLQRYGKPMKRRSLRRVVRWDLIGPRSGLLKCAVARDLKSCETYFDDLNENQQMELGTRGSAALTSPAKRTIKTLGNVGLKIPHASVYEVVFLFLHVWMHMLRVANLNICT